MKNIKIYDISLTAIFIAIIVIVSQFSIITPFGIPLSFQVFAISLAGYVLKPKFSVLSVLCYVFLGAIGVPVFSGFIGGIQHIIGATGGFIIGFIFIALFCSFSSNRINKVIFGFIGLLICHIIGIIQFSFITGSGILESIISVSLPYLVKDIVLLILASLFADRIKYILNKK